MKKIIATITLCIAVLMVAGCKKQANGGEAGTATLQKLAEKINSENDTTLQNGTKLTQCDYKAGDSIFTYQIQVDDNRYDKVNPDSLKMSIGAELVGTDKKAIATLLAKNNIGLKYVFTTPNQKIEIVFTPEELAQKAK